MSEPLAVAAWALAKLDNFIREEFEGDPNVRSDYEDSARVALAAALGAVALAPFESSEHQHEVLARYHIDRDPELVAFMFGIAYGQERVHNALLGFGPGTLGTVELRDVASSAAAS
jgi:hypothetical protein